MNKKNTVSSSNNKTPQILDFSNKQSKKYTLKDLRKIDPKTKNQEIAFDFYKAKNHISLLGSAGTGKSFLASYFALKDFFENSNLYKKIIIVRNTVPTREVGFLPGTEEEKIAPFELPIKEVVNDLLEDINAYDNLKSSNIIKFLSTYNIRGLTWDNSIIIIEEAQNMTFHEINSIMTRVGEGSRVILTGDIAQKDLNKKGEVSGLEKFIKIAPNLPHFKTIFFTIDDIVRSEFVKNWIIACENID